MSKFLKIVITSPNAVADETSKVCRLLEANVCDLLHLRKPQWSRAETTAFLRALPQELLGRIRLHDHFELCDLFPVGGVQLNARNSIAPASARSYSRSCHTLDEIEHEKGAEYVTLSPIFDSISKTGYCRGDWDGDHLSSLLKKRVVIALGGIEPSHFRYLQYKGFSGAALLGYVWNNPEGKSFDRIVTTLKDFQ